MPYYNAKDGMTVKQLVAAWVAGNKAYDDSMPIQMDVEDLWKYREYTRSPEFMRLGYAWPYNSDEGKLARAHQAWMPAGQDRWDMMSLSMGKYGWEKEEPAHLIVGKDGKAKLGEGNHRLAIWKSMGKKTAPVMVHFVTEVIEGDPGVSRPPSVAECRFKEWFDLHERTLYHGTVIDYEDSIRKYGLQGGWHDPKDTWVGDAYDDEYGDIPRTDADDVVFMTDKEQLSKAVGGMVFHIGKKLGKSYHDVSDLDIRNNGLLVIIKDSDLEPYDPYDRKWASQDIPRGAEEGDYFDSSAGGDIFLRGSALLRFLIRNGQWPRSWGAGDNAGREKIQRDRLARMAISKVKNKPKSDILNTVQTAPFSQVKQQLKHWGEAVEYPWRIWQDALTKEQAERLLAHYQTKQPVPGQKYEFRITPTEFHGEGFWQLEGRRTE